MKQLQAGESTYEVNQSIINRRGGLRAWGWDPQNKRRLGLMFCRSERRWQKSSLPLQQTSRLFTILTNLLFSQFLYIRQQTLHRARSYRGLFCEH